ncbi:MAG: hypothetical protein M1834_006893 [Cirrosporium novae-zelandiae]|nr:MAG: hypothetical protein M1834_006893 [Cirrosporium novae-zelandiae]
MDVYSLYKHPLNISMPSAVWSSPSNSIDDSLMITRYLGEVLGDTVKVSVVIYEKTIDQYGIWPVSRSRRSTEEIEWRECRNILNAKDVIGLEKSRELDLRTIPELFDGIIGRKRGSVWSQDDSDRFKLVDHGVHHVGTDSLDTQ